MPAWKLMLWLSLEDRGGGEVPCEQIETHKAIIKTLESYKRKGKKRKKLAMDKLLKVKKQLHNKHIVSNKCSLIIKICPSNCIINHPSKKK